MSLVWYVSYGSNMHIDRFACYVAGGTPDGGNRCYPGCRDITPPLATRGCSMRGGVYFATESPVWGGGRAFYDPQLPGVTYARAYLITASQFADVYAQEMYRLPGTDLDLREVLENGRIALGDGRYETLIHLGDHDGYPMLTFTAPWSFGHAPLNAPTAPYLRMLGHGLLAAHGWSLRQAADYLTARPGAAGVWSPPDIIPVLYPYVVLSCAMTVDGSLGTFDELLVPSSDGTRHPVDEMRAGCDAILVAAGSRIEVTSTTSGDRPADRVSFTDSDAAKLDLRRVLHELAERGVRRLVVEGGPTLYSRLISGKLADELQLVVAPTLAGDRATSRLVHDDVSPTMTLAEVRQFDDLAVFRYRITRWDVRRS